VPDEPVIARLLPRRARDSTQVAGWKSSIGLLEASSSRICEPPEPVIILLRKLIPFAAQPVNLCLEFVDDQMDAVPAAWAGSLVQASAARPSWSAPQQQP
jgi:hypothetical protein